MKKSFFTLFTTFWLLSALSGNGQHSPIWIRNMNTLPDSALLFPVKTLTDVNDNVFVLSTYYKYIDSSSITNKIMLKKFDTNGTLLWELDFNNGGAGEPRGYDMKIDISGNCFIAGGFTSTPSYVPLLMKVSDSGSILWLRDSTIAFNQNYFSQLIFKDNIIYVRTATGIAVFDTNGNEVWSEARPTSRIAVDNFGRLLVSSYPNPTNTLFRYNVNGGIDFAINTIVADRIEVDYAGNIYLFAAWPNYEFAKHDSDGVFQWGRNAFPLIPGFGDQAFEMLVDHNLDILLVGLADTIFKFRPDGSMIWRRTMNGLDNYAIGTKITNSNHLAVTGSIVPLQPAGISVLWYDLNGNISWQGSHQSNLQQEIAVSLAFSSDGVYVLEDSINNSSLLKFQMPQMSSVIDYSLICVDSVWYEPGNPQLVNIRVFNGNFSHLNYPSIQMLSPTNDTISNPSNWVNFFAHIGNRFLIYQDTITVAGITDFGNYSFLISEGIGDTTVNIGWCSSVGIEKFNFNSVMIFPNPAENKLNIKFSQGCKNCEIQIISSDGKVILEKDLADEISNTLDIEGVPAGLYFLRIKDNFNSSYFRFIKL